MSTVELRKKATRCTYAGTNCFGGKIPCRLEVARLIKAAHSAADKIDALRTRCLAAEAERDALKGEVAAVLEDRARFPDKPDFVGRMIDAHIRNLKAAVKVADGHAYADRMERDRAQARLDDAFRVGFRAARPNARPEAVEDALGDWLPTLAAPESAAKPAKEEP